MKHNEYDPQDKRKIGLSLLSDFEDSGIKEDFEKADRWEDNEEDLKNKVEAGMVRDQAKEEIVEDIDQYEDETVRQAVEQYNANKNVERAFVERGEEIRDKIRDSTQFLYEKGLITEDKKYGIISGGEESITKFYEKEKEIRDEHMKGIIQQEKETMEQYTEEIMKAYNIDRDRDKVYSLAEELKDVVENSAETYNNVDLEDVKKLKEPLNKSIEGLKGIDKDYEAPELEEQTETGSILRGTSKGPGSSNKTTDEDS